MSEHTPQHHPHPTTAGKTGSGRAPIDLVPGEQPVPITVWRTARSGGDIGRSVGERLAARLIAAYSRVGDVVVDLTDDHALAAACTVGRRRHHPAWFTDTASLIVGPPTAPALAGETGDPDEDALELRVWFGDDLTDPNLPPTGPGDADPAADTTLARATSLVVGCWPLDDTDAAARVRLAWLLATGSRLLRPGGCLILIVAAPDGVPTAPEDFTPLVQAAAGLGLGYLQHVVAVTADTAGDTFVYHATDEELLTLAGTGQPGTVTHLRVHADLLVFSHTGTLGPARRRSRDGRG